MQQTGRPKLNDEQARSRQFAVRFTQAEVAALVERATAAGFPSVSEFVRAATLSKAAPAPRGKAGAGVFSTDDRRALLNIGNNLNQIARVSHGGRPHSMLIELRRALDQLDTVLDRYLPK